jgi:MGT family glycosyltransferase
VNVLFSVIPGHGHFFPNLPLARALVESGHRVRFASSASYGTTIREHGFEAVAVGLDYTQTTARGDTDDPGEVAANLMAKMFRDGPPAVLETLTEAMRADRPDVVLVDTEDFGAQVAAERVGVPAGSVVNGVRAFSLLGRFPFDISERDRAFDRGYHGIMRRLREAAGVPDPGLLSYELPHDRTLNLCMAPPSLEAWPLKWVSHTAHPLRPEVHSTGDPEKWLEDLPRDRPIVAVTFGTLFGSSWLYQKAVRGALAEGARVIATTSYAMSAESDRLVTVPWVSPDRLMEVSDAAIHHGGWGSTVAAIVGGLPAVVVPLAADQPAQAARLSATGAAVEVRPGPSLEADIGAALAQVLADPTFRKNTERLRDEIAAMPAAPEVVPLVEELAATGGPVLNRPPAAR